MTHLLDGNVLVAIVVTDHEHHELARSWFQSCSEEQFATCPITQGTLLRFLIRAGLATRDACSALALVTEHPRHVFWADDLPYSAELLRGVLGHRQVTDAYLAGLARRRSARLVTLDKGLAALHPDVAHAI